MITFDKEYYVNIDGDYTYKQPVAYCFCGLHTGYLTVSELKTHKCISKNCIHLYKNTSHQYWQEHSVRSLKKRYHRMVTKNHKYGLIKPREYVLLRRETDTSKMRQYIVTNQDVVIDRGDYQTKSNYVPKKIIIPKKPSLYARIKNDLKIKYNKILKMLAS